MRTITRGEYDRVTAGIGVPKKVVTKKATDIAKVKAKAIQSLRDFTMKVEITNPDGTTTIDKKFKPYKTLSFKELGDVKVVWTNDIKDTKGDVVRQENKESIHSAVQWEDGRVSILMGWYYKSVVPVEGMEGIYTFPRHK